MGVEDEGGCPVPVMSVSLRQLVEHSMCSCYGEESALSLKKITQRGWGCESCTARKISQNG